MIEPTLWRRVDLPLTSTLLALHDIIPFTVGWSGSHLFEFVVTDRVYSEPLPRDRYLTSGMPLPTVTAVLGHVDLSTTGSFTAEC